MYAPHLSCCHEHASLFADEICCARAGHYEI